MTEIKRAKNPPCEGCEEATPVSRNTRPRPQTLRGATELVRTGHGSLYVTVNLDEKDAPFEVFATLGKAGGCDSAQLEAISRLISLALRSGIALEEIVGQLSGITCCPVWDSGVQVKSSPDALALCLGRHTASTSIAETGISG